MTKETGNIAEIRDYDLDVDKSIEDHDAACVDQAGRLIKIGYLEYETAVYAIAYRRNGERYYFMSAYVNNVEQYQERLLQENIYSTPIKYFFKRYDLITDSEEEIKKKFRREIALIMDNDYPDIFFEALEKLTEKASDNQAYALLKELAEQLEDSFDSDQLQLFAGLLPLLRKARLLNAESEYLLHQWLEQEKEKNMLEIRDHGYYKRAYYGFAYQKPQKTLKYFIDALRYRAYERQEELLMEGYTVTPIFTKMYFRDSYQELNKCRNLFAQQLAACTGEKYIKLMAIFGQMPPSVDEALYRKFAQDIKDAKAQRALEDFQYFGRLWHVEMSEDLG